MYTVLKTNCNALFLVIIFSMLFKYMYMELKKTGINFRRICQEIFWTRKCVFSVVGLGYKKCMK